MNTVDQKKLAQDVIYLIGCFVNEAVPDRARIESMDLEQVYSFASGHMVSAAVAMAMESAGVKNPWSGNAISAALRRTALFDKAWEEISKSLEEQGIWYMPLKGTVLKAYYPKYGMREMADHDILFDGKRADAVKAIMEGCEKHFSPEDFYLYMIAHEYKHYTGGGTGLRSVLDTYVYLRKKEPDMDYVAREASKLGILDFEVANRSLAKHLFSDKPGDALTDEDQEMLDYILSSGTYGTITHSVENKMRKNGWGKARYAWSRFLVPVRKTNEHYTKYAGFYPFFYRHRILLPILPFYRTFRAIKKGRFRMEAQAIRNAGIDSRQEQPDPMKKM